MASSTPALIAARCSKPLKRLVKDAEAATGTPESDFVRTAVFEFFQRHPTRREQMQAVVNFRAKSREGAESVDA